MRLTNRQKKKKRRFANKKEKHSYGCYSPKLRLFTHKSNTGSPGHETASTEAKYSENCTKTHTYPYKGTKIQQIDL